jgi:outer membrane protein TolC
MTLFTKKLVLAMLLMAFFQVGMASGPDTLKVAFTMDDLYALILKNHPVARQAYLLSEDARQQLRFARGAFDPKIFSDYSAKDFKGTNYFQYWNTQLKVPVWLGGVDLFGGFERNRGQFLSPESITNNGAGLAFAGVAVPLGQGLLIDQRRAIIRQAQIFQELAEAEKVKILNKLLLEVAKDYWQWYFFHYQYELFQEGFELALFRFNAVKLRVMQGDQAPIDSVEAKILVQQREINLRTAEIDLQNARLLLSNHIWNSDGEPVELSENLAPIREVPLDRETQSLSELHDFALTNHPEILKVRFKIDQLEVERNLAREMRKPVINFKYNFLTATGPGNTPPFDIPFFANNYKMGMEFMFPIFLRKERAKLQLTNIKLDQTNLDRMNLNRIIINDINVLYNEVRNLEQMLGLQEEVVRNNRILLNGERSKFFNGESSLFLVNVRESNLIDTEVKYIDMVHKFGKAMAELRWAAGMGQ